MQINWIKHAWSENKGLIVFFFLMLMFRSSMADWSHVPTGSMQPTIVEGDRIFVNKMAYDIRVPFTHISLARLADPQRGDIVIFDSKVSDRRLVKRVIGVPGDVVEMRNNRLFINTQALGYTAISENEFGIEMTEDLLGAQHQLRVRPLGSSLSSFNAVRIPDNYYLALGDNRDNSADSRVIGLVPRKEIVGRTRSVVMSLNRDNYYLPRQERFFKSL